MFFLRYKFHFLFFLAYIGALVIEKPVFSGNSVADCFSYMFTVFVHFSLFAGLILTNKALLIPFLLDKKRFSLYVAGLISLVLIYTYFAAHYNYLLHHTLLHDIPVRTSSGFWDNFVYALCCTVIAAMLHITQKWSDQEEQVKNIQINQLQTELKYLRSQINPHFLFNGLNSVYGSIEMSNLQARDMMVQFSDLLRYNLYEADVEMIALEKEIKYLENYVALQKARSNDNVEVSLVVRYKNRSVQIAPLIFMAFVENAFKYASRDDRMSNRIIIHLKEENGQIHFTCENTFHESEISSGGIGLNNAARRLELLYKDRYKLDIKKEHNIYLVDLTLSL